VTSTLTQWLAGRTQSDLEDIIARRPDVLSPYPPDDLGDLAERLHYPHSLRDVLFDLPQPCLELLETLLVFGSGGITRAALAAALHRDESDPELDGVLNICEMWAIAWVIDGKVWVPGALRSLMPSPLRLGPPVAELLGPRTVDDLRSRANALELSPRNRKTEILAAIEGWYADANAIRAIAASAPADQRELLEVAAWINPVLRAEAAFLYPGRVDPAISWLLTHGLVVADWQRVVIPREVGIAVRGTGWHPTLTPLPPAVPGVEVGAALVDRDAAAAANTAIEQFGAVVEACGATPVALLKTGGVGVREIRRLAKATKVPETTTRLWLELAYSGDLVDVEDDELVPTPSFDEWLALPPARRLTELLVMWTDLRTVPLLGERPDGVVAAAALTPDAYGSMASELRRDVLGVAAALPEGVAVSAAEVAAADQLRDALTWRRPVIARLLSNVTLAVRPLWLEAGLLGLVGRDAVSSLGRALIASPASEEDEFLQVASLFAHDATAEAIFQADLTIVVPGTPTAALAHLLDAVADRESRGAAGTWRCNPDSVRRALDAGHTASGLVEALRAIAVGGILPQPLEYLIADMARRHGTLRVRAVGCIMHANDPALLAEIASTKSLRSLKLSVVAPTVLVSTLPVDRTLAALRSAGFAPVGEAPDGTPVIERRIPRRAAKRAAVLPLHDYSIVHQSRRATRFDDDFDDDDDLGGADLAIVRARVEKHLHGSGEARPTEPSAIAEALLAPPVRHLSAVPESPRLADAPVRIPTLRVVQRSASQLTPNEQHILAQAIDNEREIRIEYVSSDRRLTNRVIQPIELDGGLVIAWCHLRDDERAFSLSGIVGVEPA
jgi:XPB/Ssl2-like helicase family protein/WYL domain-containing protein